MQLRRIIIALFVLIFSPLTELHAQTITLSPSNPTVALGKTLQMTAQVTVLLNTTVTWSVEGVVGGNATVGTISTSGLYRAPAAFPANAPLITATSKSKTGISGSAYVYLLSAGPKITKVSPNPVAVGNLTVTISGTGFLPDASVFDSYGSVSSGQLTTTSVTSTKIVATGWQGAGTTATFSVKNPGSDYSNSLSVPIGTPAPTYTLTVVGGAGSGTYPAGKVVTLTAGTAPTGDAFLNWTGATVADSSAASTTITMPSENTTVTANFAAAHKLTVVNGTGGGTYATGKIVTLTANAPPVGQAFLDWTGATVANAQASPTTITMPAKDAGVTAHFGAPPPTYLLSVVNGSGSGSYPAGSSVTITANAPPAGQVFVDWTGATVAAAGASSTTITMPAAATTVTANYGPPPTYALTVVNGSGSGSYTFGTVVTITANSLPGQSFVNWTGATVASSTTSPTTLTMPAQATTVTANFTAPVTIPYPVSTHPRLWITPRDLTRLQSWAVPTNPIYAQGMVNLLTQAVNIYNTQFFPGGIPNPNYPDPGDTQGYTGYLTEQYGAVLAFNSLIDPNPTNRITYAQDARNLLMYAMNQAALGPLANAPFRDPMFPVYNRANGEGEQWPLIVDWIYNAKDAAGNPILPASDKLTIRNVFMTWANECLNASTTGGDHPVPIGVVNSPQLLPGNEPYRMASNNYYLGHARLLTMMALSIDPSDDPPVTAGVPVGQLGNSLRSYLLDANGAWLYQEFAMMGDPSSVATAYGLPGSGAGFGLASGGLPPEGMLYGHSFGFVLGQLLALQTAGFNDSTITGPQSQLINSPVWDRYVNGYLASLVPTSSVAASQPWLGPVYEFASYGDLLRLWVTPDVMQSFSLLALLNQENGKTSNMNAARWLDIDGCEGGPTFLMTRITDPWSWSSTDSILYFMLLDPAAAAPTDPRPGFPTTFYDPGAGRIVAHSDWSLTNTMFDYRASWESINHQDNDGGQFELYRNGEWLTKEMSNYDNNAVGLTTTYHNTLALQNWSANGTPNLAWFENGEWANGSEWNLAQSAGDPTTVMSTGPGYIYAASNLTNLFNLPDFWTPAAGATDISQATRSIVWLNNDYIVVYDRATSIHSGLFKKFNLSLVTHPTVSGSTSTETLPSGQQLFIQTLLPASPTITSFDGAVNLNPIAQLEPTQYVMQVQDATLPSDTRFLHVLQGANPGVAMTVATHVQSTSGTAFDGAVFGASAVYFPVSATTAFTTTTFPAPAGVTTMLVTGLTPNGTYGVGIQANGGGGSVVTVTVGGTGSTADSAGLLVVSP